MMISYKRRVEKIVEQELSSILVQSVRVAHAEKRQEVEDVLTIILRVIDARRTERERAGES